MKVSFETDTKMSVDVTQTIPKNQLTNVKTIEVIDFASDTNKYIKPI